MSAKTATEHMTQSAGHIATGAAGGSGLISFVSENSALIGVTISLVSLVVGFVFYWLNYQLSKRRTLIMEKEEREKIRMQVLNELRNENIPAGYPTDVQYATGSCR